MGSGLEAFFPKVNADRGVDRPRAPLVKIENRVDII